MIGSFIFTIIYFFAYKRSPFKKAISFFPLLIGIYFFLFMRGEHSLYAAVISTLFCACWLFLADQDLEYKSVRMDFLVAGAAISLLLRFSDTGFFLYFTNSVLLTSIVFIVVRLITFYKKKKSFGEADYIAILCFSLHIEQRFLGLWLASASMLAVLSFYKKRPKEDRLSFIPYLFLSTLLWAS